MAGSYGQVLIDDEDFQIFHLHRGGIDENDKLHERQHEDNRQHHPVTENLQEFLLQQKQDRSHLLQPYLEFFKAYRQKQNGHTHQDQCFFPDVADSRALQHDAFNDYDEPFGRHQLANPL